ADHGHHGHGGNHDRLRRCSMAHQNSWPSKRIVVVLWSSTWQSGFEPLVQPKKGLTNGVITCAPCAMTVTLTGSSAWGWHEGLAEPRGATCRAWVATRETGVPGHDVGLGGAAPRRGQTGAVQVFKPDFDGVRRTAAHATAKASGADGGHVQMVCHRFKRDVFL